ncbi:hypothetical protein [Pedobacter ginsengisoli]|uniref:hypothetical protein n=1 Tax=Pedobacter ginsengisoli TaxID=363852 RepID=UPI00254BFBB1|nr:hypothetical protein [Pedobacter ginsengisoli]
MKTNYLIFKTLLTIMLTGVFSSVIAQTSISSLAEFTTANAKITDLTQIICATKQVQLSVPPTSGITYVWETRTNDDTGLGTGTPLTANTGSFTEVPPAPGFYTYKLKATNTATQCSEIFEQVVFVMPAATLTITPPSDVNACTNETTATFAFTSSIGSNTVGTLTFPVDYEWFSKKGTDAEVAIANSNNANLTVPTFSADGVYQIYARATFKLKPACAPAESNKPTITITPAPDRPVITIASN